MIPAPARARRRDRVLHLSTVPSVSRIHVLLPEQAGDATWNAFDDTTASAREWTRWGIAVPVQEAYDAQAQSGSVDDQGTIRLHMP